MRLKCFATTVFGLEDYAAEECRELIGVDAKPDVGKIMFEADLSRIIRLNLASRTLHRVFVMLARARAETLEDVYRAARSVDYTPFIGRDQSFAVRGERHSRDKPFTSLDMAAAVGRAVIESFKEETGVRLKVNLDQPDVQLYCLIRLGIHPRPRYDRKISPSKILQGLPSSSVPPADDSGLHA